MFLASAFAAAAALITVPAFIEPPINHGDWPSDQLRMGKSAGALLDLRVAPDGKVFDCLVRRLGEDGAYHVPQNARRAHDPSL